MGRRVGVAVMVVVMEVVVEGPKVAVVGVAGVQLAGMTKEDERSAIYLRQWRKSKQLGQLD